MRVGILSDTHGVLRPEVPKLLAGCERLLHAGDVGSPGVLEALRKIAPVDAVRGNVDEGPLESLPPTLLGDLARLPFAMVHRREDIPPVWVRERRLVLFGHSHRPELAWQGSCLFLNPGACGPRRFSYPLTLAIVRVVEGRLVPEILAVE
jgi:putative phosphoesterase